jgi:hypothetical protein
MMSLSMKSKLDVKQKWIYKRQAHPYRYRLLRPLMGLFCPVSGSGLLSVAGPLRSQLLIKFSAPVVTRGVHRGE